MGNVAINIYGPAFKSLADSMFWLLEPYRNTITFERIGTDMKVRQNPSIKNLYVILNDAIHRKYPDLLPCIEEMDDSVLIKVFNEDLAFLNMPFKLMEIPAETHKFYKCRAPEVYPGEYIYAIETCHSLHCSRLYDNTDEFLDMLKDEGSSRCNLFGRLREYFLSYLAGWVDEGWVYKETFDKEAAVFTYLFNLAYPNAFVGTEGVTFGPAEINHILSKCRLPYWLMSKEYRFGVMQYRLVHESFDTSKEED